MTIEYSIRKETIVNEQPSAFESYESLIYYTLRKLNVPDPHEDYIQEAYFVYDHCTNRYDPSLAKFSTYFTHQLLYYYKSLLRKNSQQLRAAYMTEPIDDPIFDVMTLHDIYDHCHLTNIEKMVVTLSLEEYTVQEVAFQLGISVSTVKRTRKSLKQKILRYHAL